MTGEGPRYDIAAGQAGEVCNLLGGDYPGGRAELFGKVLFLVLDGSTRSRSVSRPPDSSTPTSDRGIP